MIDFGMKFKKDFDFGDNEEEKLLKLMRAFFGDNIKRTCKGHLFDYYNDSCYIELKSRNCFKDTYNDTMIGFNKIQAAENNNKDCFFCFNFKDGVYYWKYNKDDINNGLVYIKKGGRCDRGRYEIKDYAFINKNLLKELS